MISPEDKGKEVGDHSAAAGLSVRLHGKGPYRVAFLHGGPGAAGAARVPCQSLATRVGIMEPLQRSNSLDGQIEELRSQLLACGDTPFVVLGHSWGAWLALLFTARYPEMVAKLILIGSGPFEQQYVPAIMATRMGRLSEAERAEVKAILTKLEHGSASPLADATLARFGKLMDKADTLDPLPNEANEGVEISREIYNGVWPRAKQLRESGEILELASRIICPVVALHGREDSHPWQGVAEPLRRVVKNFHLVILENCAHTPWHERHAVAAFYQVLVEQIKSTLVND